MAFHTLNLKKSAFCHRYLEKSKHYELNNKARLSSSMLISSRRWLFASTHVIPDYSTSDNIDRVKAALITHGHEDHIGGIPFTKQANVPIYAGPFALAWSVETEEHGLCATPNLRKSTTTPSWPLKISRQLSLERLTLFQSLGDCHSYLYGKIVCTGGLKFDFTPVENLTCIVWLRLVKKACSVSYSPWQCVVQPTNSESRWSSIMKIIHSTRRIILHPLFGLKLSSVSSRQQKLLLRLTQQVLVVLYGKASHQRNRSWLRTKLLREPLSSQMKIKDYPAGEVLISVQVSGWEPMAASLYRQRNPPSYTTTRWYRYLL